jgi:hypothetical protein
MRPGAWLAMLTGVLQLMRLYALWGTRKATLLGVRPDMNPGRYPHANTRRAEMRMQHRSGSFPAPIKPGSPIQSRNPSRSESPIQP